MIGLKRPPIRLFVVAVLAGALSIAATGHALTLEDAVRTAWSNSPQLGAQKKLADLSRSDQWRRFLPNEPQLQYASNDDDSAESLGLSETFSFPGRAFASMALDEATAGGQEAELGAKRYEVAQTVIQAYLDNASALAQIEEQKKAVVEQEALTDSLRRRYELGHAAQAQADYILSNLQLNQAKADLEGMVDKANVSGHKLAKLLGLEGQESVDVAIPDDLDPKVIHEMGAATADESRARAAIAVAKANASLSGWNQWPDISLGIARNYYPYMPASPSGKDTAYNYSVSLTMPLLFPFHEAVESERASRQAVVDRSAAEMQLGNALADQEDAAREYRRSRRRLADLRQTDLPQARSLLQSDSALYQTGKLGFADLVLARQTLTGLLAQEIQLRVSIISTHLRCLRATEGAGSNE